MTLPVDQPAVRSFDKLVLSEVILLGGMGVLLLAKWLRDQLVFYIHPRYTALMVVAAMVLLLMAAVRARDLVREQPARGPGWRYLLLAVPLLLGVLVPAQPLGADALAGRGLDLSTAVNGRQTTLGADPAGWNLLEWATALSMRGEELDGAPVDVEGFVYQDATLGRDSFYLVRYVLTCCAADGAGVGLPVLWSDGATLPNDQWLRVRGRLVTSELGGVSQPAIEAVAVEPISRPANPYLYP